MPHGVPTDKKIETGDFITMDFGAVCGGYRSDMTRTVAVGKVSDRQKEVYGFVGYSGGTSLMTAPAEATSSMRSELAAG